MTTTTAITLIAAHGLHFAIARAPRVLNGFDADGRPEARYEFDDGSAVVTVRGGHWDYGIHRSRLTEPAVLRRLGARPEFEWAGEGPSGMVADCLPWQVVLEPGAVVGPALGPARGQAGRRGA